MTRSVVVSAMRIAVPVACVAGAFAATAFQRCSQRIADFGCARTGSCSRCAPSADPT